jgi:thiol-disulfide isomerase/thioredoxin
VTPEPPEDRADHEEAVLIGVYEDPPDEHVSGPVRWRIGKLSIVFISIVGAGLIANTFMSDSPTADAPGAETEVPAEPDPLAIDVAGFPLGALGGEPAPPASFELFDGTTFDLSSHLANDGRPVVLNLWASWCGPCRTEMPEFDTAAAANPEVLFVGVAIRDNRSAAEAFSQEIAVSYPLGIDEDGTVDSAYPSIGLPTTFLIGADGVVTHQIQGQLTLPVLQAFIDHDFGT